MAIGAQIKKEPSYGDQARQLAEYDCRVVQIFVKQPRAKTDVNLQYDSIVSMAATGSVRVYAHANYLSHMCKPDGMRMIGEQMYVCNKNRFHGLVIHLENLPVAQNIEAAITIMRMREVSVGYKCLIIFEIVGIVNIDSLPPGESSSFESAAKLKYFIDGVAAAGYSPMDFGVCIDTAHLWTMGYNCRMTSDVLAWVNGLGDASWIKLFHLNDNKNPIGGRDNHETIGVGRIWPIQFGDKAVAGSPTPYLTVTRQPKVPDTAEPGFIGVLRYAKQHNIDVILERDDALDELRGLMQLYNLL